jgi:hypothetical protein
VLVHCPALCRIAQEHSVKILLIGPALCDIVLDNGPALCDIALDNGPALCHIAQFKHIFGNSSANSKQKLKIFYCVNQGPRWDCLMKKQEVKNLVTLSL